MKIHMKIQDDFNLQKIISCGQCFRAKAYGDGKFRFITGSKVLYIRELGDGSLEASCSQEEWQEIWTEYFDLGRDYACLRRMANERQDGNGFVRKAVECGTGLRVLRQDPWEMLVTFIISQRKNIPAIAKAVEILAQKYGHPVVTESETICSFPTPEELSGASVEDLRECGLGYRAAYVRDAVVKALSGQLDLKAIAEFEDERLFQELMKVRGVGKKVANCVCLFGYGRSGRVPVDVWIDRAIREDCQGRDPFPEHGQDAGIIQQYIFYYEKHKAEGSRNQEALS